MPSFSSITLDLLTSPPRPLVIAAADSSSPMLTHEKRSGIILNSNILRTLPPPNMTPLILMASLIEEYSSLIVGKNLITTAKETAIPSGTCIFCMQDMNSPILVVLTTYQAVIIAGMNCTTIPQYPISSDAIRPSDCSDRK